MKSEILKEEDIFPVSPANQESGNCRSDRDDWQTPTDRQLQQSIQLSESERWRLACISLDPKFAALIHWPSRKIQTEQTAFIKYLWSEFCLLLPGTTHGCSLQLSNQHPVQKKKNHSHDNKIYLCILFVLTCSEIFPSGQHRCNHHGGQTRVCKHAALNMTYYSNYMTHFPLLIMQVPSCSSETPIHQEQSKLPTPPEATAVPVLLSGDISKA